MQEQLTMFSIMILFFFIIYIINYESPEPQNKSIEILSVERGKSLYGRFSIFGGNVEDYITYAAYVDNGDGGYRMEEIVSSYSTGSDIIVYEDNNRKPSFNWEYDCTNKKKNNGICDVKKYIIVPEGTLILEFNP